MTSSRRSRRRRRRSRTILLDVLVRMVGGRSRVEAMLDARYAAADAEIDALEIAAIEARAKAAKSAP